MNGTYSIMNMHKHILYIDKDAFIYKQPPFPCLYLHSCTKSTYIDYLVCTDEEWDLYESSAYCGILMDKRGYFADCHPKVNPRVSANTHKHIMEHIAHAYELKLFVNSFLNMNSFVYQQYFKDCVFDLCVLDGASSILCEAIEAYVNECQDRGVNIPPWRNQTFCRESTDQWSIEEWKEGMKGECEEWRDKR